jgi:hypothetical protein
MNDSRTFLRHALATLAYRTGKAIRDTPPEFAIYRECESSRTPVEILAHMGDLIDWALSMVEGHPQWHNSTPLEWHEESSRFFAALKKFDDYLAEDKPLHAPLENIFQGPVADALTHTGQLAMLRRVSGMKMKGENYYIADIAVGRVGENQAAPKLEY